MTLGAFHCQNVSHKSPKRRRSGAIAQQAERRRLRLVFRNGFSGVVWIPHYAIQDSS